MCEKTILKRVAVFTCLAVFAFAPLCRAAAKKKTAHRAAKSSTTRSKAKSSSRTRTAARTYQGRRSRRTYSRRYTPPQPRHYGPQSPTPERYREIQQALADKGFFKGEIDGQWGTDSVEALKAFQQSQNLEADGKIGSLSLIALGLGPKRAYAAKTAPVSPSSAQPQ